MAWARSLDLYLNVAAPVGAQLVRSAGSLAALERPSWIAGDKFNLRLNLRQPAPGGTGSVAVELEEGDVIAVAGVKSGGTTILFLADDFENISGETEDPVYEGELNLNTSQLVSALGNDLSMLTVVDVEIRNADNTERRTLRFNVTILKQVYAGDAPAPTAIPDYPPAASLVLKSTDGLHTRVAMPAATTDPGEVGQFAANGDELALYVAGTGWVFFTGHQK